VEREPIVGDRRILVGQISLNGQLARALRQSAEPFAGPWLERDANVCGSLRRRSLLAAGDASQVIGRRGLEQRTVAAEIQRLVEPQVADRAVVGDGRFSLGLPPSEPDGLSVDADDRLESSGTAIAANSPVSKRHGAVDSTWSARVGERLAPSGYCIVLAQRRPKLPLREVGAELARFAARIKLASLSLAPPLTTRLEPSTTLA
jgi:hypothetical protein